MPRVVLGSLLPLTLLLGAAGHAAGDGAESSGSNLLVARSPDGGQVVVEETWRLSGRRISLLRRVRSPSQRSCLEVTGDTTHPEEAVVAYRRWPRLGTPAAVDRRDGELTVRIGQATETITAPPSVPTSMLRFLPPTAERDLVLLLEPFGSAVRGRVTSAPAAGGGRTLTWEAAGLTERVGLSSSGELLWAEAPAVALSFRSAPAGTADVGRAACARLDRVRGSYERLIGPPPAVADPHALERWVANRIRYVDDTSLPTPAQVLAKGQADCAGMAFLAGAVAEAKGWGARQVLGTVPSVDGGGGIAWHQWAEILHDGRWTTVDPASPNASGRRVIRRFRATPAALLQNELLVLTARPADLVQAVDP
jgi:hypothetical protein